MPSTAIITITGVDHTMVLERAVISQITSSTIATIKMKKGMSMMVVKILGSGFGIVITGNNINSSINITLQL